MLTLERQNQIIELLKEKKVIQVSQLAKQFYTCESTIRRDLQKLEKMRLIKRTYGGAVLREGLNAEIPLSVREREQADAKNEIGRLAADLVEDGDSIIMDSSSTTFQMLKYLKEKKELVIITNGLKTAAAAGRELNARVYCTGGSLRENSSSLIGSDAGQFIRRRAVQKLFFSCRAVSSKLEAMDVSDGEAGLREVMRESAAESYLLCDQTKFGKTALNVICSLKEVDALITDQAPSPEYSEYLSANAVRLIHP